MQAEKYADLLELITSDKAAKKYFDSLTDYVRRQIFCCSSSVNSMESLENYVEKLTKNDD